MLNRNGTETQPAEFFSHQKSDRRVLGYTVLSVKALSSINIGHYATKACIGYVTKEEKRNATFVSYTNGSLFWMPYILAQIVHAHGRHEVSVKKLMKSILVVDILCIVFDTTTFKRKDWPDNEVSSLTIYPSWHRALSTVFHLESFV